MEEAFNEYFIAVKSGDRIHKSKVFKAFYLKGITEIEDIIEFLETKDIELNKKLSEFGSKQKGVFIGIKCKPRKKEGTPTNAHSEQPESPASTSKNEDEDVVEDIVQDVEEIEFLKEVKQTKTISDTTAKNYELALKRLNLKDDELKSIDTVVDHMKNAIGEKDKKGFTRAASQIYKLGCFYLGAVIWKLREMKTSDDIIQPFVDKINQLSDGSRAELSKGMMNEKELSAWKDWNKIITIRDEIPTKGKNNMKKLLILSLYTYLPPRRVEDYFAMYFYHTKPKELSDYCKKIESPVIEVKEEEKILDSIFKEQSLETKTKNAQRPSDNYFIKDEGKFYFCSYKTVLTYGMAVIDVPDELYKILKAYVDLYKKRDGEKLLNYIRSSTISDNLRRMIGNGMNVSMMRKIYITHFFRENPNPTEEEKTLLARQMGHSVRMQCLTYNKNSAKNEVKKNEEEDKDEVLQEDS